MKSGKMIIAHGHHDMIIVHEHHDMTIAHAHHDMYICSIVAQCLLTMNNK